MDDIVQLISQKRLDKYQGMDTKKAFEYHLYNSELSESFYPSISYFEIILRNKIDFVFSKYLGNDWLFDEQYILDKNIFAMETAKHKLSHDKKDANNKNHIISELSFGFWTFLFSSAYERVIWNKHPNILIEIFNEAKDKLILSKTAARINRVRIYRNKIFHYGSLLCLDNELLKPAKMHNMIYSMIKDLGAKKILNHIIKFDRFNEKYNKGKNLKILKQY